MKNTTCWFLLLFLTLHIHSKPIAWTKSEAAKIAIGIDTSTELPPAVTTSLWPSCCNYNLPLFNTLVGITTLAGGPTTRYRIRATNGTLVQIIDRGVPHFTMLNFPIYDFSTTYTIEIELQRNGVWEGVYGPACTVTTPPAKTEAVMPELCGVTLNKVNGFISAPSLQFTDGYRYRVTNLTDPFGPDAVQIFDRPLNWFTLQMLNRYNYGMTYRVEVALKTFGIYGPYGMACNISTPAPPVLSECGATVASAATNISCPSLALVNQYRFQIIRASDYSISTIDLASNYFNFNMLPAAFFTGNETYIVRVAVLSSGTWSPFGAMCEIVSPASTDRISDAIKLTSDKKTIEAAAYPNPFHSKFTLKLTPIDDEIITVKVYDMLGRLVVSETAKGTEHDLTLGANFPIGVYSIIMCQGEEIKTLRVIKR
jgi:hypothetical protein